MCAHSPTADSERDVAPAGMRAGHTNRSNSSSPLSARGSPGRKSPLSQPAPPRFSPPSFGRPQASSHLPSPLSSAGGSGRERHKGLASLGFNVANTAGEEAAGTPAATRPLSMVSSHQPRSLEGTFALPSHGSRRARTPPPKRRREMRRQRGCTSHRHCPERRPTRPPPWVGVCTGGRRGLRWRRRRFQIGAWRRAAVRAVAMSAAAPEVCWSAARGL